ncbi:flagellar basal-body rod protein FlgF [Actimicrobium sp. CCC2.4]|uniref:flagellar basal-body rod protein FlgF n=1 Tax=Actimicrobium sp. CCC2.4 TaxID=3048606 RepID=UPI002AC9D676|nr:flagellar basal-body rod protein FlgF [Actimicrobium sp. CCC2.4]MEB0135247.1 flagellar basal-body rod protein FlgF [Actimicrobium sp. CCC2.4]WPX31040.1 flagellar basal-body rod protein FlgF [Actimicrobium sp. CCC2.4]
MDRMIYTAMTGAKHVMEQQSTTANNLANATTVGFRAQLDSFRAVPVLGPGLATRAFVVDSTVGADFSQGALQQTGRALDVAIQGKGWLAVDMPDGTEAYTRHGSLKINENGLLQTQSGFNIVGDSGPITIPPDVSVTIAKDGTVSSVESGSKPGQAVIIGRIKLVNPPEETMTRGDDTLFRVKTPGGVEADPGVTLAGGALESSNVNVVDAMVNMISLSRQFEMHMSLLKNAETNSTKAAQILAL